MRINTKIIDRYLENKPIEDHWIYDSIIENEHLFELPLTEKNELIIKIYKKLIEVLKSFKPLNKDIWQTFFGDTEVGEKTTINLIIGCPDPYDAMVRKSEVFIDLFRISTYSDDMNVLENIILNFLTHELAHIIINEYYPRPESNESLQECLEYIAFDEGIAHFLAFKENILSVDWYSEEMNTRRTNAYKTFSYYFNDGIKENHKEILIKSNSGAYWDKFASIAGLFALLDYYKLNGENIGCFKEIFNEGPKELSKIILGN